jgi:hypothetical protein
VYADTLVRESARRAFQSPIPIRTISTGCAGDDTPFYVRGRQQVRHEEHVKRRRQRPEAEDTAERSQHCEQKHQDQRVCEASGDLPPQRRTVRRQCVIGTVFGKASLGLILCQAAGGRAKLGHQRLER